MDISQYQAEYNRLDKWRSLWIRLAHDFSRARKNGGRLQTKQERIERRVRICNSKIEALMKRFDAEEDQRALDETETVQKQSAIEAIGEREAGWYWVTRKSGEPLDGWTPAYWTPETRHFQSAFFSGVPEAEFIVGQALTAPGYNATIKAIGDLGVFDNG